VFPELQAAGGEFYGYDARGAYWSDIGTPAEYRRASRDVVLGTVAIPGTRASGADPTASIASDARVDGPVWIGPDARIEAGATVVGPSVIGEGVTIGAGARVEGSILWQDAAVGEGATLRDAIVGRGYRVAAGASLDGAIVANEAEPATA
jgi:mannose-1-phosphate guanylyltransferase